MKNPKGLITALITPFKDNKVDYASLEKLVSSQLAGGVEGFVVNGTTAESPTLTHQEVESIFSSVREMVPKNFPIILGTGSNSTQKTIDDSKWGEKLGADYLLVVVPYYNKPPQKGLFEHFKAVASNVNIPVILYNVPGRTITSLELETVHRLSEHPNIIGIKEASGKIDFAESLRKTCGREFILLSGDDGTYDGFKKVGGDGVISVASHIIPQAMAKADIARYKTLIDFLFIEANPIPVKMALYLMGIIATPDVRLPLVTMSEVNKQKLQTEMQKLDLI